MPEALVTPAAGEPLTEAANTGSVGGMTWQHPLSIPVEQLEALLTQAELEVDDFTAKLLANTYQVYRVANVLVLVVALPKKLMVLAMLGVGSNSLKDFRRLASELRRLARAWGLETIETSAYDFRVKRLLEMVGSRTLGWHMELKV